MKVFHRTHIKNLELIKKEGLKINQENNLTTGGIFFHKAYKINPIFLSLHKDQFNTPESKIVLSTEVKYLFPDLPSLADLGLQYDEHSETIFWEEKDYWKINQNLVEYIKENYPDEEIPIQDIFEESTICELLVKETQTGVVLTNIPVEQIVFNVN